MALDERGVHIQGSRRLAGPALDARDQRPVRLAQPREGAGLQRDRRVGPGLPQGAVLHVERLEEVPHGGRRGQGVPEQGRQGLILAQRREVLAAVPAARPQRDEALDELQRLQPALALFDWDVGIDRLGHPELAEQLDHERHSGPPGDQRGVNGIIDLERQPRVLGRHRRPPCERCTHWVKTSKPDAINDNRVHGGFS